MKNRRQAVFIIGFLALSSSVASHAAAAAVDGFWAALDRDDSAAVRDWLQRGADPNLTDADGQPAAVRAVKAEAGSALGALLQDPRLRIDETNRAGETALMLASLKGRTDWMAALLARGARVHQEGWSPILYAASHAGPEAVAALQLLRSRGAPLNARSPNGTSPVMMAARYGSDDAVRWLIAQGADWRTRNDLGLSVIDFAEAADRSVLVQAIRDLERRSGRPIPPASDR